MTWTGFGVQHEVSLAFLPPTNSSSKGFFFKANGNLALKKGGGLKSTQTKIHFATLKKKTEKKTHTLLQESSRPQCKVRRFDCFFNLYPAKHPPPPKKKKTIFSQKTRRSFFCFKLGTSWSCWCAWFLRSLQSWRFVSSATY